MSSVLSSTGSGLTTAGVTVKMPTYVERWNAIILSIVTAIQFTNSGRLTAQRAATNCGVKWVTVFTMQRLQWQTPHVPTVTTKDPIQTDCRARTFRILRIGTATIRTTLMTAVRVVLLFVTAQELDVNMVTTVHPVSQ